MEFLMQRIMGTIYGAIAIPIGLFPITFMALVFFGVEGLMYMVCAGAIAGFFFGESR
jgi:hypothetical protein